MELAVLLESVLQEETDSPEVRVVWQEYSTLEDSSDLITEQCKVFLTHQQALLQQAVQEEREEPVELLVLAL